jgi:arylformamidase
MTRLYHDLTLELSPDVITPPGDRPPRFEESKSISRGDPYNLTTITLGTHTGTHIDVPRHFYNNGMTIDQVDFDCLIGRARVIEITGRRAIDRPDLEKETIQPREIILLKTDNSSLIIKDSFDPAFTYLTPDAARYLVEAGIKTLGFDYFSVEALDNPLPEVHYQLLGNKIIIIEGLDLSQVKPGEYAMAALPLKVRDGNGSPARVVLIEDVAEESRNP